MLRGTEIRPGMTAQIAWGQDGWPTSFAVEVDNGNENEVRRYAPEAAVADDGTVTDDERRRVARELRGRLFFVYRIECTLARMLGTMPESCDSLRNPDRCDRCGKTTCSRLADLIEPSCDREASGE